MARFVVLRHEMPAGPRAGVHWDLMLEQAGVLRTWALAEEPAAQQEIAAQSLGDHRLDYLEYEGPVSGDRGSVSRWDEGEYESQAGSTNELVMRLRGGKLNGTARLRRQTDDPEQWVFDYWV
jgi:DNA polymerase Ligase (LigD)